MHCFVSGRVQGVCFRAATRQFALDRGLRGWVRNLPDGRVELLAVGADEQLDALRDWLSRGPERARVDDVACRPATDAELEAGPEGFQIK